MNASTLQTYHDARKAGNSALSAHTIAKTVQEFQEALDNDLVKLEVRHDEDYEPDSDIPEVLAAEREAYERDGAYGVIGYYRDEDGEWQHADSVWGFVGYRDVLSPIENPYVADIMFATLASLPDNAAMI